MRIWFGLILKITARMKSYILPELRYFDKINRLMREITILFGGSPQLLVFYRKPSKGCRIFFSFLEEHCQSSKNG